MKYAAFFCGAGVGMTLGAIAGMTVSHRRRAMKTCVGRTMQNMGSAVDCAWEDLLRAIR